MIPALKRRIDNVIDSERADKLRAYQAAKDTVINYEIDNPVFFNRNEYNQYVNYIAKRLGI